MRSRVSLSIFIEVIHLVSQSLCNRSFRNRWSGSFATSELPRVFRTSWIAIIWSVSMTSTAVFSGRCLNGPSSRSVSTPSHKHHCAKFAFVGEGKLNFRCFLLFFSHKNKVDDGNHVFSMRKYWLSKSSRCDYCYCISLLLLGAQVIAFYKGERTDLERKRSRSLIDNNKNRKWRRDFYNIFRINYISATFNTYYRCINLMSLIVFNFQASHF